MTSNPSSAAPSTESKGVEGEDKAFADFLGQLVDGKVKDGKDPLPYFAEQLAEQRNQHQTLARNAQQAEQQLKQLQGQIIKVEGQIEQGIASVRHFWKRDQGGEPLQKA